MCKIFAGRTSKVTTSKLTDLGIRRIAPPTGPKPDYHWCPEVKGFAVRVYPSGKKVFHVQARPRGSTKLLTLTIGDIGLLSLKDARDKAREFILECRAGRDPIAARRAQKIAEAAEAEATAKQEAADSYTLTVLLDDYLLWSRANHKPGTHRSWTDYAKRVRRDSGFADRPAASITEKEWRTYIHSRPPGEAQVEMGNHLRLVKAAYGRATETGKLDASPVERIKMPKDFLPGQRDRILSDAEIVKFWKACDQMGGVFAPLFQLLLLTGARLREVAEMQWSELPPDFRTAANPVWTIPLERMKTGRRKGAKPHKVPLSPLAVSVLSQRRMINGCPAVFTAHGQKAVRGFSDAKDRIDALMGVEGWVLHDLRRTFVSGMQALGIGFETREHCVGHVLPGVAGRYSRYDYEPEKRKAMDTWAAHIARLVGLDGTTDTGVSVVPAEPAMLEAAD
jgi:integrase